MKLESQDVPDPLETADLNAEVFTDTVQEICDFNEFYTVYMGMLNDGYLDSGFSITECRTLFELKKKKTCRMNELAEAIYVDQGYMSRIIKRFRKKGLVSREPCEGDGRAYNLSLTEKGENVTEELASMMDSRVGSQIEGLSIDDCKKLKSAMGMITNLLSPNVAEA
ncbi:MAG: MarR family winged helix-turn-helix transcriptional regulator [Pseudoramibacter sp.]